METRTLTDFIRQYNQFRLLVDPNATTISRHMYSVNKESRFSSLDVSEGQTMSMILEAAITYYNIERFPTGAPFWNRITAFFKAARSDEELTSDVDRFLAYRPGAKYYGCAAIVTSSGIYSRYTNATELEGYPDVKVIWRGLNNTSVFIINGTLNELLPRVAFELMLKLIYKEYDVDIMADVYSSILENMWSNRYTIPDVLWALADGTLNAALEIERQREVAQMYKSLEKLPELKSNDSTQITNLRNNIDLYHSEIRDCQERISRYMTKVAENYTKITRDTKVIQELQKCDSHPFVGLTQVFKNLVDAGRITKFRVLETANNNLQCIRLRLKGDITYWEDDEVGNWLSSYTTGSLSDKIAHMLFDTNKRFLYTYEQDVDIRDVGDVKRGDLDGDTESDHHRTGAPRHPHIGWYNCFGNNATSFYEAWSNKEYDIALAIMNNALCQINLTDYCVTDRLIRSLKEWYEEDAPCKCIHDTVTDKYMTIREAMNAYEHMNDQPETAEDNTEVSDDANN